MEPQLATLLFDDAEVGILPGDTIAATLMRAGILSLRRSRLGTPRGLYCGIGICHECLVDVGGEGRVRACLTDARPGMRIRSPE